MVRVFYDANAGTAEVGYLLWFARSISELAALGDALEDGAEIILYDDEEADIPARLVFDAEPGRWRAVPLR